MATISPEKKVIDLKHPETERAERREAEMDAEAASWVKLDWVAYECDHEPKERRWFIIGGVVAAILILISLYSGNYFFALFVALAALVVYLYANRPPKEVYCSITPHGIQIGQRLFEFESLASFWIFYEIGGIKHLSLQSKRAFLPFIRVPLGDVHPAELRTTLRRFVPEREHEESLVEILSRLVGF